MFLSMMHINSLCTAAINLLDAPIYDRKTKALLCLEARENTTLSAAIQLIIDLKLGIIISEGLLEAYDAEVLAGAPPQITPTNPGVQQASGLSPAAPESAQVDSLATPLAADESTQV